MRRVEMKKQYILGALIFVIALVTVGFALLQSSLSINGTVSTKSNSWNIYFDNIQMNSESVSKTLPTISNRTSLSFNVELDKPGDLYEFSVDAVNDGTLDAMINNITATTLTVEQAKLIDLSYTYEDGASISSKDYLKASTRETIKVLVKYKEDIESADLTNSNISLPISIAIEYVQADETAKEREETLTQVSFAEDSWKTIQKAVQSGDYIYKVGDTKTVDMGSLGTHTLRVANTTTPTECATEGFSQTACGFVLEFADIITRHNMNPVGEYQGTQYNHGWNKDGFPASSMHTYLENDVYNALPATLRKAIIPTKVVSSHGNKDTTNFTTTENLYLLSAHEVWEDVDGDTSTGIDFYDTSYNNTRQLDYYKNLGVTTSNYSGAIKQYYGSNYYWWLRSARSVSYDTFLNGHHTGTCGSSATDDNYGVSPAFRIA